MVVKHHPPPHVAQKYRIPKIWKGDLESDIGKSILNCDDSWSSCNDDCKYGKWIQQQGLLQLGDYFQARLKDGQVCQFD